ncbi:hypothetical protein D3C81_2237850 [compost metagenome]
MVAGLGMPGFEDNADLYSGVLPASLKLPKIELLQLLPPSWDVSAWPALPSTRTFSCFQLMK